MTGPAPRTRASRTGHRGSRRRLVHASGCAFAALALALLSASAAHAHHEAIFGPQSSAVLSASRFASGQVFTREVGSEEDAVRQTTAVFSAGREVRQRLSVALVLPVTFAGQPGGAGMRTGFEDALVSLRYRAEPSGFTEAAGLDESYFMVVGGIELPTGTLDHRFGRGAPGAIGAALIGVEKRPFSAIGYGYYHHTGAYRGARESGNVFTGAGAAWTPIDDTRTGRLFSVQVGLSHERTFAQETEGANLLDSGGSGVFVHQGLVWGLNARVQVFGLLSLPVTQEWRAPQDRQRFRLGAGAILVLGH